MPRPKSKEDGRRETIVQAALRLILKLGYNKVTLADIAEQVGVSKGLISYYFPKKEDVFLAVLDQIVDRLTSDFEAYCNADATAPEKLMMFYNNLFGNEKRARRYYTVVIDYMAQAIRMKAVQEYTQHIYDSYRTYIERIITDGSTSGEFQQVDARRASSMALGMMEGLMLQWFFDKKGFDLEDAYVMCVDFMNVYLMPPGQHVDGRATFNLQIPGKPRVKTELRQETAPAG
jgi:TetR/AcrR family transcriptional regulator, fatty acid metabolism regulator protein